MEVMLIFVNILNICQYFTYTEWEMQKRATGDRYQLARSLVSN